jgi:hypothetical protein
MESSAAKSPIVIGGLGGSGTRVVASLLNELDFYIGNYLNEQKDNLWFTFLLRRPRAFHSFKDRKITDTLALFDSIMQNSLPKNYKTKIKLYSIAAEYILNNYAGSQQRFSFPMGCVRSILTNKHEPEPKKWSLKEPNSHLFIEQLQNYYPGMKYILVIRHPLDMAFGNNFLQLYNWGHMFQLPRPSDKNKNELMLKYYDIANSRAIELGQRLLGTNFTVIKLEELCEDKQNKINELLRFLNINATEQKTKGLLQIPESPSTLYRYKNYNWQHLEKQAEEVCQKFGYRIE